MQLVLDPSMHPFLPVRRANKTHVWSAKSTRLDIVYGPPSTIHASKSTSSLCVVWVKLSTESDSQNIRISQAYMGNMLVTPCGGLATLLAFMLSRAYTAYLRVHVNTPINAVAQR